MTSLSLSGQSDPSHDQPQRSGSEAGAAKISYQGEPGANSHLAAREAYPDFEASPIRRSRTRIAAVKNGEARYAMIPIENSVAGRVADIHHLLAGRQPLHRRRALPARAPSADGEARSEPFDDQTRDEPHAGAGPMPRDVAEARSRSRFRRPIRRVRRGSSPKATI